MRFVDYTTYNKQPITVKEVEQKIADLEKTYQEFGFGITCDAFFDELAVLDGLMDEAVEFENWQKQMQN